MLLFGRPSSVSRHAGLPQSDQRFAVALLVGPAMLRYAVTLPVMRTLICCLFLGLVGCGSSSSSGGQSATAKDADTKEEAAQPKGPQIPKRCARGKKHKGECLPPPGWG